MSKKTIASVNVAVTNRTSELYSRFGLTDDHSDKLSTALLQLISAALDGISVPINNAAGPEAALSAETWVAVDIISGQRIDDTMMAAWAALGLANGSHTEFMASGLVRLSAIGGLAAQASVGAIQYAPFITSAGLVPGGAHVAIGTGAINTQGYTGTGVMVGVLSDSYNMLGGGITALTDIASGDLPASGVLLVGSGDHTAAASDEGRAMLQIVHDIAPGATLAFATAFNGSAGFANNIRALAAAGAKVIVDDVRYGNQLTFTDDVIRDAIEDVTAAGVSYFTSNGNQGTRGVIEVAPTFKALGAVGTTPAGDYVDFLPGTAAVDPLTFTATQSGNVNLRMTWASRAPSTSGFHAYSDIDVFVKDSAGTTVGSAQGNQGSTLLDPVEFLSVNVTAAQTYTVWVQKYSGQTPSHLQVNYFNGAQINFNASSGVDEFSSAYGHSFTSGGVSVAAGYYRETAAFGGTNTLEAFSSYGQAYHTHDQVGNPLPITTRSGAEITSVDGLNTTFFGNDRDGDGKPNFSGTSASAPSIAAVAALLLQQNPFLTPAQLLALLQSAADPANRPLGSPPGTLFDAGAGMVDPAGSLLLGFQGTPNPDTIRGANANDNIYGFASADNLTGENGDDNLWGGAGGDVLNGGSGFDQARYDGATSGVQASLLSPGVNTGDAAGDTYIGIEGLVLTSFNDFGYGSNAADTLSGQGGQDELYGQGGNDTLNGGDDNDNLWGGAGGDAHDGGSGFDYARYDVGATGGVLVSLLSPGSNTGDAAGDTYTRIEGLVLTGFNDSGYGGNGADTVFGLAGQDDLHGQGGNDTLYGGDDADNLWGGAGGDVLDGGSGFDYARYDVGATGGVLASLLSPGSNTGDAAGDTYIGIEGLVLTGFNDSGYGGNSADTVFGQAGQDNLYGQGGNDTLYGGDDNDYLSGGAGADAMDGGSGFDTVRYDISATMGLTVVLFAPQYSTGEAVGDTFTSIEGVILTNFGDVGHGSHGNDTIEALDGDDLVYGQGGDDRVYGGAGHDQLWGGLGADLQDGGAGFDYVRYDDASFPSLTASLIDPSVNTGAAAGDTYFGIEGLILGYFDDTGYGTNAADYLYGNYGNDNLYGNAGADNMYGGGGNDMLYGGNDADVLDGGDGYDYARYDTPGATGLTVVFFAPQYSTGAATGDSFVGIEGLVLTQANDVGHGSHGADTLLGQGGDDLLYGQGGNDSVYGGDGFDQIWGGQDSDFIDGGNGFDYVRYDDASWAGFTASLLNPAINTGPALGDTYANVEGMMLGYFDDIGYGSNGADYLYGINGNDTLHGLGGDDNINGNQGNDTVIGGAGNDTIGGSVGADIFRFETALSAATNLDTIIDFEVGIDKIQLENTGVFAALGVVGALAAANFRSGAGVTTAADANDFILYNTTTGALYYDLDGTGAGAAVQFATLTGAPALTANDFAVI